MPRNLVDDATETVARLLDDFRDARDLLARLVSVSDWSHDSDGSARRDFELVATSARGLLARFAAKGGA